MAVMEKAVSNSPAKLVRSENINIATQQMYYINSIVSIFFLSPLFSASPKTRVDNLMKVNVIFVHFFNDIIEGIKTCKKI